MAMLKSVFVESIVVVLFASIEFATASPTSPVDLQKRAKKHNDDENDLIDGTVPIDAILLVGVALFAALLCLLLTLWHVNAPNHSGSRIVREERARAKAELRIKGGGGAPSSPSPSRMAEKKRHQSSTTTEMLSSDSHSKLILNEPRHPSSGPKMAQQNGKPSRASRGYSTHSKFDVASISKGYGYEPSLSMLAVPTLPTFYNDNASSQSLSSGSVTASPPPPTPWHARPQYQDRSQSSQSHSRRISTTVGRGTDLHTNRNKKSMSNKIHVNPQGVDPIYSNAGRHSPRASASDFHDPLAGSELKRYSTDPSESREGSRRNSAMNALDFFNSGNIRANYSDNASDSGGHEYNGLTQPSLASPLIGLTRTKNMSFYDGDQDTSNASAYHDASLLEEEGQDHLTASNTSKGGWRMWGKI
ncbi:hypothetical protein CBS101457_004537 [Exobasidium rhododendri]|nr:hypothetical protein CBS101457_004537 [Exobasidium rhododendri]